MIRAVNAFLLAVAAVFAAILLRYLYVGWQVLAAGEAGIGGKAIIAFYVVPALVCGVFAWVGLVSRNAALKVNLALTAVTVVFALYLIEGVVSMLFPPRNPDALSRNAELAKKRGIDFDARTKFEVIAQLRKDGTQAYPQFALSPLYGRTGQYFSGELLPLAGLSGTTVVACNELGAYMIYRTDEHGFNNPPGLYGAPVDVMVLGGSHAEGECVKPGQNTADVIRAAYPGTLNLGMGGTGPLQMLARLREYGPVVRPKVVVWMHNVGDLDGVLAEGQTRPLLRYLEAGFRQDLPARQGEVDRALLGMLEKAQAEYEKAREQDLEQIAREERRWWKHLAFGTLRVHLGLMTVVDASHRPAGRVGEALAQFDRILALAKAEAAGWGGTLLFAYLGNPVLPQVAPEFLPAPVLDRVSAAGVPTINLHELFVRHPDPASLMALGFNWNHPNEAGYRLMGEALVARLREDPRLKR